MTGMRWGLFVGSLAVGLVFACSDEVEGPAPPAVGGTSGAGGTGQGNACQPTDPICFGNRPATSKGSECLAARDNSATPTTSVQMRQTWFRSTAPPGNTINIVYQILTTRS